MASFSLLMISIRREQRVGRRAAVHAGVQVGGRALRLDLGIHQAAQADAQRGQVGREQFGVGDQREVRLQLVLVLADVVGNGLAADFLFAFQDDAHVDRQLAVAGFHQRLEGLQLHPELAFVVHRAASIDVVVALGGLKRRRLPLVQRLGGLHVVVRVAEHGRLARGVQPVGIDQRMRVGPLLGRGGDDLDVLEADALELVGADLGRFFRVLVVLFQGADAGDSQQVLQLFQEPLLVITRVAECGG